MGGYIRANAARGAVAGLNGDFFLLARNGPSSNLLIHNGQSFLGAGTTASQFAQALLRLGFVEALGMDIDSSANVNWRGTSLNRPDYQRQVPTGIIAFRRAG